ncbi:copper resistance protein CopD [Helicobacter sp. 11S02596-1]|uniref:copper resistance protein CopD n=1 Tax=Helicobacter sp. 11S02596-1 TaxID=1476194 RepID=UPI000BA6DB0A|nr:copper resistance protein CopD [Helicobacter sp. 11S02596-1]PAF45207.1 copper resistance protein CopD [Helicobacter sp. 11S02596-1]
MQTIYPFVLTIHLICAIIFLGYLFFDVFIFPNIEKKFGIKIAKKAGNAIGERGTKIMPICVLLLILTGGMMISSYIGKDMGYFNSNLQKFLILKVIFALGIFIMVFISLSYKFILKKPSPIGKIIHPVALLLGFFIVVLAKMMFYA